jgi:hypothetical protein
LFCWQLGRLKVVNLHSNISWFLQLRHHRIEIKIKCRQLWLRHIQVCIFNRIERIWDKVLIAKWKIKSDKIEESEGFERRSASISGMNSLLRRKLVWLPIQKKSANHSGVWGEVTAEYAGCIGISVRIGKMLDWCGLWKVRDWICK